MSPAEIQEYVDVVRERRLREHRHQAYIAFRTAVLINKLSAGTKGKEILLQEEFPLYWSKEETDKMKAERFMARLNAKTKKR